MKHYLKLPSTFARDRIERDCELMPKGIFIGHTFRAWFDEAQLQDLIADARHYAVDVDEAPAAVKRSARRVVETLGHLVLTREEKTLLDWGNAEFARRTRAVEDGTADVYWLDPGTRVSWTEICAKAEELGVKRVQSPVDFRVWFYKATMGGLGLTSRPRG